MLLPIDWLKDYVDLDVTGKELADVLTLSGSHVESISSLNKGVEKVLVGRIESIEKHPNADKLVVCQVDLGDEVLQIVTGADNVKSGDYVPVAVVGAKLPGSIKIKKTEFRGVDSYGMLVSLKELDFSDHIIARESRDGIFILDQEYPLGQELVDILGLNDEIIEIEITPNRPDCLSIFGMAREAAASFKKEVREKPIEIKNEEDHIKDYFDEIQIDSDNCKRYYSKIIKDVDIKPSPLWLQKRLMEAGMRPISNIVDITNYVMLEYGQPLHAFDLEKLNGRKIIVRQAEDGELLETLDGVERKLDSNDLLIADENEAIAIAGVMGGLDTEVTNDTKMVLLEGASFDEKSIRLTAKKFNLRSEASNRFEKGIDPALASKAVDRVCQLVEEIGAGKVVAGHIDVDKTEKIEKTIKLRPERANLLLGLDLEVAEMLAYLNDLGLDSVYQEGLIETRVPSYRMDLSLEVDLIEEIGRLYGFHRIESQPLVGTLTRGSKPYNITIEDRAKSFLISLGYNEVMTYSFISPKAYDKIKLAEDSPLRDYIKLLNPLGEDYSSMRRTLIPNMMDLLTRNHNRSVESVFAFEIGNVFIPNNVDESQLPDEKKFLCLGFYGDKDFYFLKESVEQTLARLGIHNLSFVREEDNPSFHPGRTAKVFLDGQELGTIGEIHVDVSENYGIDQRVYMGHLDFDLIVEKADFDISYKALARYPAMSRDLALLIDEEIMFGQIEAIVEKHGQDLIEEIELFDIYRGDQVPEGKKSVAFSIVYRSHERTLKEEEINEIQKAVIEDLEKELEASLRS